MITDGSWLGYEENGSEAVAVRDLGAHGVAPWGAVLDLGEGEGLAAAVHAAEPTAEQWRRIQAAFAAVEPRVRGHEYALRGEIEALKRTAETGLVSVMVMQKGEARQTFVLERGRYDRPDPSQPVEPAAPASIAPWPAAGTAGAAEGVGDRPDRLALARWIVSPANPLTARVEVNRLWQLLFGTGLVETPNDFGAQGAFPSHPELLDELALALQASGWDRRRILRAIALTRAYRRASSSEECGERLDPANRLLWRGPRHRLDAEILRDVALQVGGLLELRRGGPSVLPAQPFGLWQEVSHFGHPAAFTAQSFYPSRGGDLHRRSLYTFWKRTCPPPTLASFDAPTREVCSVLRARTNTPLQALAALNDPDFVAAARGLARGALERGPDRSEGLRWMFRRALLREPSPREIGVLVALMDHAPGEREGWFLAASTILNLDEMLTKR